jgi:hypothetical protein
VPCFLPPWACGSANAKVPLFRQRADIDHALPLKLLRGAPK